MAIEEYYLGQPVRIKGFFFSDPEETTPVDVATSTLTVKPPNSDDDVYTDATHDGTGRYSRTIVADEPGAWHYRWDTTNPVCVVQGMFTVYERNV